MLRFFLVNVRDLLLLIPVLLALSSTGCDKHRDNTPTSISSNGGTSTLLATIKDAALLPQPTAPSLGVGLHTPQEAPLQPIFSIAGNAAAYIVETDSAAYVVRNDRAGKQYDAVGNLIFSPDGSRLAYGALFSGKWHMVVDGQEGAAYSAVKSPQFSPDGRHLAYQALSGDRWHLVVDGTPSAGTLTRYIDHRFSGDSRSIVYIDDADDFNRQGRLVMSDLSFASQFVISPAVRSLVVSPDGMRFAAIELQGGKQHLLECRFDQPGKGLRGPAQDFIAWPAFGHDGAAAAYAAMRDGRRVLVYNGREENVPEAGELKEAPVIMSGGEGVSAIVFSGGKAFYHLFFSDRKKRHARYDEAEGLTVTRNGSDYAYAARKGDRWFIVANGVEGPGFDRVISPKFSPDGKHLVYRARQDGRRFIVTTDRKGGNLRQHDSFEQVFDLTFVANGKSVGYGVKDGRKLTWQVAPL